MRQAGLGRRYLAWENARLLAADELICVVFTLLGKQASGTWVAASRVVWSLLLSSATRPGAGCGEGYGRAWRGSRVGQRGGCLDNIAERVGGPAGWRVGQRGGCLDNIAECVGCPAGRRVGQRGGCLDNIAERVGGRAGRRVGQRGGCLDNIAADGAAHGRRLSGVFWMGHSG